MGFEIPDFSEIQSIPGLIDTLFDLALWGLGLAVFIQILRAGYKRFFAFGNPSKASESNQLITGAVIGTILLLSSVMILRTINPDLVKSTFNLGAFRDAALKLKILEIWNEDLRKELGDVVKDCNCDVIVYDQGTKKFNNEIVDFVKVQIHDTKGLVKYIRKSFDHEEYFDLGDNLGVHEFTHATDKGTFTYILASRVYRQDIAWRLDCSEAWRNNVCDTEVQKDNRAYLEVHIPVGDGAGTAEGIIRRPAEGEIDPADEGPVSTRTQLESAGYQIADGVNLNLRTETTRELVQFAGGCSDGTGCHPIVLNGIQTDIVFLGQRYDKVHISPNPNLLDYIIRSCKSNMADVYDRDGLTCSISGETKIVIDPGSEYQTYIYVLR